MFGDDKDDDTVEKTDSTSKKNDDNSNEEDDDSTDDSDSNDDKGSDKGKSKDDDDTDITKQYFTDPNSLPKEVRGAFKKMQGKFTKKMQEASRNIEKAEAFDQLILDPDFRRFMEAKKKGNVRSNSNDDDSDDDDGDDDRPITRKEMKLMQKKLLDEAYEPFSKKERDLELKMEATQFKKDNPDWKLYQDEIVSNMSRHPTLSYQEAYDLASKEEREEEDDEETIVKKKKANVSKPSKTGAKDVEEKKGKMTINEAFQLAKKKLKML